MVLRIILAVGLLLSATFAFAEDGYGPDAKLDQRVTYQVRGERLGTVVDSLAEAAGVNLRAGTNSKDWEVLDRRVNLFVNKLPLRSLMDSISRVTGFKWQISGDAGSKTYRLVWDEKSKAEAIAALNASSTAPVPAAGQNQSAQANAQPADMEYYPGYASTAPLTAEQKTNLQLTSPFLAWWENSGMAKAVGGVLGNVPGTAGAIASGSKLTLTGSQLSVQGKKAVQQFLGKANRNGRILGGVQGRGALRNIRKNLKDAKISVNQSVSAGSFGSVTVSYGKWSINAPLLNSNSATANAIGKIYSQNKQAGRRVSSRLRTQQGDLIRAADADLSAATSKTERPTSKGSDKAASSDSNSGSVKEQNTGFKPSSKPLSFELMRAGKQFQVSIVSDWFGDPVPIDHSTAPVPNIADDVLDDIADRYEYTWEKAGAVSEFRDEESLEKAFYLIPEQWLEPIRKVFVETGTLDIDQLAVLSQLNKGQLQVGLQSDEILGEGNIGRTVLRNLDMIRLFSVLSPAQRQAVFSQGLDLKTLAVENIPLAKAVVAGRKAFLASNDTPLVLRGEVVSEGKSFNYHFVVSLNGDENQSLKVDLKTPVYNAKTNRKIETVGPKILVAKTGSSSSKAEGK